MQLLTTWLPLTNDYDNLGYDQVKFYNVNCSIASTGGKVSNKTFTFNGSNTYIYGDVELFSEMTFAAWVKFNGTGSYHIMDIRASSGETGYQPMYGGTGYGLQVYSSNGGSYTWSSSTCGFTTGVWYHLAVTITSSSATLYINGVSKGTASGAFGYNFGNRQMRIGTRCSGANWFNGNIQDVRVYSGVLEASEIAQLAKALVLHYDMDSCYEKVPCIQASGAQGIVLPYTPTSNDKISIKFSMTNTGVTSCLWCARGSTTSTNSLTAFYIANSGVRCDYGTNATMTSVGSLSVDDIHTLTMDKNKWYLDGTLKTTMTAQTFTAGGQIRLFSSYTNGETSGLGNYSYMKMYNFKCYDSKGELKLNLIPVIRSTDLVAGLYDTVSDTFYTSSTALLGYHPVEYIENTSVGPYINTGCPMNANMIVQTKVMPLGVTGGIILGNTERGDSSDWRLFNYSSNIYFDNGSSRINGSSFAANTAYEFELGNFYVKNLATGSNIISGSAVGAYEYSNPIYVNGISDSKNRWYYIKFYYGNRLYRDLIPAIRTTDSVAGLYDRVQDKFYTNAGSGSFSYYARNGLYKIYDKSGNGNNATLQTPSAFSLTNDTNSGMSALRNISGDPAARINVNINPSFIAGTGTICFWYKKDSTAMNYNGGNFLVATQNTSGSWLFATSGTSPFNSGSSFSTYYIDGVQGATTDITDTKWHHYAIVGVNLSSWSSFSMQAHGDTSWLWRGNISNFKIFNTSLSATDIQKEYDNCVKIYTGVSTQSGVTSYNGNKIYCNGVSYSDDFTVSQGGQLKLSYVSDGISKDAIRYDEPIILQRKQVEYIESSGTQYIILPVTAADDPDIEIKFRWLGNTSSSWTPIYGARGSSTATYIACFIDSSGNVSPNYAGFDPGTGSKAQVSSSDTKIRKFSTIKGNFYIDDKLCSTASTTNTLTGDSVKIALFAVNTTSSIDNRGALMRLYSCKIRSKGKLLYDLIPIKTTISGIGDVGGLYDCCTGKTYYSDSDSNFSVGPEVGKLTHISASVFTDDNLASVSSVNTNKLFYNK